MIQKRDVEKFEKAHERYIVVSELADRNLRGFERQELSDRIELMNNENSVLIEHVQKI